MPAILLIGDNDGYKASPAVLNGERWTCNMPVILIGDNDGHNPSPAVLNGDRDGQATCR